MDDPPSYEESAQGASKTVNHAKIESNGVQHLSIHDEVGASRSQVVAALVEKLLPQIRTRAKQGLSKTTLLLLPSDQSAARKGRLVGFPEDEQPIAIQLEGHQDTAEFWTQEGALDALRNQMLAALSSNIPAPPLPERSTPPPAMKSSFWGRKQSKTPQLQAAPAMSPAPVTVEAELNELHFRTETEYGLFETLRARGVLVSVVIR